MVDMDAVLEMKQTALPDAQIVDAAYASYPLLSTVTMNAAAGYANFTDDDFPGRKLAVTFTKNNVTGGNIWAYITIKKK